MPTDGLILADKSAIRFIEPLHNTEVKRLLRTHNSRNSYVSPAPNAITGTLARVMSVAGPIPALASVSVLQSAPVGGSVVGVVGPL